MRAVALGLLGSVLLIPGPAAAQKEWLRSAYDDAARGHVAKVLKDRGIDVPETQVQILRDQSSYPRVRRRTGTAYLGWKVDVPEGAGVQGTVKVKGEFGRALGWDKGIASGVIISSANPRAESLMKARTNQIEARDRALDDAKQVFRKDVSDKLGAMGYNLDQPRVSASLSCSNLERADFTFKNKVPVAGGKRVIKGQGSVAFTWQDGKIAGMTPKDFVVKTNRWTFGTWAFGRGQASGATARRDPPRSRRAPPVPMSVDLRP